MSNSLLFNTKVVVRAALTRITLNKQTKRTTVVNTSKMKRETLLKLIKSKRLSVSLSLPLTLMRPAVEAALKTYLEDNFSHRCRTDLLSAVPGLAMPGHNRCYLPPTNLEFDFSWRSRKVSVEIHGGLKFARTGHRSEQGVRRDMHKSNLAQLSGWLHLALTPEQVMDDHLWQTQTKPMLMQALQRGKSLSVVPSK